MQPRQNSLVVTAMILAALLLPDIAARGQSFPVEVAGFQTASVRPIDGAPPGQTTPLIDFKDSEIKFRLETLMDTLRDRRHEGWVLAAYPDPKTHRPLIGAGFSLDVEHVEHPQRDPLNPHPFLEPSSAELWRAAGLQPERLEHIIERFHAQNLETSGRKLRRRVRAHTLTPDVTEEEATRLLRISAIQAIYNSRAYCRNFDQLSGPQQMALSQLVFQMGVNLEEFVQFLAALNSDFAESDLSNIDMPAESASNWNYQHWKTVQETLIDSQWARLYSGRAATVIAMFDPAYPDDPYLAQQRVQATLRPALIVRQGRRPGFRTREAKAALQNASYTRKVPRNARKSGVRARHGRSRKS